VERYVMLDFNDLRVFARIADVGSVSGAARSLNMPKSSVSRSLSKLEETLGAVLIERTTRQLRLTDAGLLLQRHARRILDDVGEAENAVGGLVGKPRGDLRVSVPFTFAAGPLAKMLPGFLTAYPEVRVILTVDNRTVDLLAEDIDVAIRIGPLRDSELIARRLVTFALWPCASPAYLSGRPRVNAPEDLAHHCLFAHSERAETWAFRDRNSIVKDILIPRGTVVPEPDVLKAVLIGGAGIGLLPDFHAIDAIATGKLVRILPDLPCGSVDAHALYPSHRSLSAKVRVFIDALVANLRPIA
jgi:DNA-binding transcriptional LysR family regulator